MNARTAIKALQFHVMATPLCDKHEATGGTRGGCLLCGLERMASALSQISYLCGPPNEYELAPYDTHFDEQAVVEEVRNALAKAREGKG